MTDLQKYNLEKSKNSNYKNIEMQLTEVQKYKLQDYRNTSKY